MKESELKMLTKCYWQYDEDEDCYITGCEHRHQFLVGNQIDNQYKYCPYCGRELVEKS